MPQLPSNKRNQLIVRVWIKQIPPEPLLQEHKMKNSQLRKLTAFNAPWGDDPEGEATDAQQIANDLKAFIKKDKDKTNKDINELKNASDRNARTIARLSLSGGSSDQQNILNTRLEVFNLLLKEKLGSSAPVLDHKQFEDYRNAASEYYRFGQSALDQADIRSALSVGSDPAGGYTALPDVDPMPRERKYKTSPMRAIANEITTTAGSYEGIYEGDDVGFGWVGEQGDRNDTGEGNFNAFKIDAEELYALIPVTQRLLDDSSIDMGIYIESRIGRRFRRGENASFVLGNGILKPRGFLDYKDTSVTTVDSSREWGVLQHVVTGAAGGFPKIGATEADDVNALYDIKAALNAELKDEAVWAMNSTTFSLIEKLRDADGRSYVRQSLDKATPNQLLGFEVVIFEDMPDVASDSYSIAFGNFMVGYQIIDKPGIRILRDPYTTKGKVKFYAYKRVGGDVVDFDAIKLLKFSA